MKPSTKDRLINTFLDEVITNHSMQIMEKQTGIVDMLDNKRYHELKLMFDLFKLRPESLKSFQQKVMEYTIEHGEKIVDEK